MKKGAGMVEDVDERWAWGDAISTDTAAELSSQGSSVATAADSLPRLQSSDFRLWLMQQTT